MYISWHIINTRNSKNYINSDILKLFVEVKIRKIPFKCLILIFGVYFRKFFPIIYRFVIFYE